MKSQIAITFAATLLSGCDITEGTVHQKIHEHQTHWWTNERECLDWQNITYACTRIDMNGNLVMSICNRRECTHWHPYRQEHIDDEDWILNVLGEDAWGDMKMRRVYVPRDVWEGISEGAAWSNEEIPDLGDTPIKGKREG